MLNVKKFAYVFDKGPVVEPSALETFTEGNCRLAVQYYFYTQFGLWLKPEQALCPELYYSTGTFIFHEEAIDFSQLQPGDIVFAQRILTKAGTLIDRDPETFPSKDGWIISLHSAIIAKNNPMVIWHATAITGCSCEWDLENFLHYYLPISVKRISLIPEETL